MNVNISVAAGHLGVSTETVRRRLRTGTLLGAKEKTAQGFRWVVTIPDAPPTPPNNAPPPGEDTDDANGGALVDQMQARIDSLETQLTTRAGEIDQLHRLLAQTALNAASGRPWWQFWR